MGTWSIANSFASLPPTLRAVVKARLGIAFEQWAAQGSLLDIALDHLTLSRATLYRAILENSSLDTCHSSLDKAVSGLRRASHNEFIARALLTRAWLRFLEGDTTGARADLDEAWEIAERGPMRLHMADIHLHRARLFGVRSAECGVQNEEPSYPWGSPQADLAAAEKLITNCGYHRRDEELADAKKAILP